MTTNPHNLTDQELHVLKSIASGLCTKEIAAAMQLSPKTVEYHRSSLMAKLNIRDTASLTRFAIQNKLVHAQAGPALQAGRSAAFKVQSSTVQGSTVPPIRTTNDLAQALLTGAAQAANGTADVLQLNALCQCSDALIRLARLQVEASSSDAPAVAWLRSGK